MGTRFCPRATAAIAMLVLAGGCPPPPNPDPIPTPPADLNDNPLIQRQPSSAGNSIFDRPMTRLAVEIKVHRISAPRGVFTGDAEIWKKVNGPVPAAAITQQLTDNGFRAAVGRESDRKPLLDTLDLLREKVDLRAVPDQTVPDASKLVELELGPCEPRLTLFYHPPHGGLRGMDFVGATAKLLLAFEMRSANLHEVTLKVVPALEEPPGPPRWVINADGTAEQVPEQRRHVFDDVVLTAQIPEGGFLLLGAGDIVYDLPYLGRPFFLQQEVRPAEAAGETHWRESIYIISPIIRSQTDRVETRGADLEADGRQALKR
ncbi:MAG TPA: hypothetical protein VJZ71_11555 [Phycisphaerae bacterium]|nr:hypothetical protein [Phycisphaerae bacterium]